MVYTIRVDSKLKKLNKTIKNLTKAGQKAPREIAQFGARFAKAIAPKDTGDTIRAISWSRGRTESSATLIFGKGHRKGTNFNLTRYMNKVGRYAGRNVPDSYWRSGNAMFIERTKREIRERFGKKVRQLIRK